MEELTNVVDWSRAQFALTAIYHWLFVPLTLGLGVIIAIMETIFYRTRDEKWLATTKFLDDAFWRELRHRCCHGHHTRI